MSTSRITPDVQNAFVKRAVSAAGPGAKAPTDASLAQSIKLAGDFFRLEADSLEAQKLTAAERKALAGPAAAALASEYNQAWGVTAPKILAELEKIPDSPARQSIGDFMAQEGLKPSADFSQIEWSSKAVDGPDQIRLAEDSLLARRDGAPRPIPVTLSGWRPEAVAPELASAVQGLRYLEQFRNTILEGYVVAPGKEAPKLEEVQIALANEAITDQAKRSGYLDARGRIADPKLATALEAQLPGWSGVVPYTKMFGVGHRGLAADAYVSTVDLLIPAYLKALESLGARVGPGAMRPPGRAQQNEIEPAQPRANAALSDALNSVRRARDELEAFVPNYDEASRWLARAEVQAGNSSAGRWIRDTQKGLAEYQQLDRDNNAMIRRANQTIDGYDNSYPGMGELAQNKWNAMARFEAKKKVALDRAKQAVAGASDVLEALVSST